MLESIGAGYIIGVMAHFYRECAYPVVGAVLFGLGLLVICHCKLSLFTGKIGTSNPIKCMPVLIGNMVGVALAVMVLRWTPEIVADAFACGTLMQMAVTLYREYPLATVGCVATFLLGGFKHCIAMLYVAEMTWDYWLSFVCVVAYNAGGAMLAAQLGVKNENQ